jgi:hypothetical protein
MSRAVFIGSQGRMCGENWARGGAVDGPADRHVWLADQVIGANQPRCLGFFLASIWRGIPTEDLTQLAAKWGVRSIGSTWSEVDRGDLGLRFC